MSCGVSSCSQPKLTPKGRKNWACKFWKLQQEVINEEIACQEADSIKKNEELMFVEYSVEKLLEKRSVIKKTGNEFNVRSYLKEAPLELVNNVLDDYDSQLTLVKDKDPSLTIFDKVKNHSVPRCDDPRIQESLKICHDAMKIVVDNISLQSKDFDFSALTDQLNDVEAGLIQLETSVETISEIVDSKIDDEISKSELFSKFDSLNVDKEYLFQLIKIIEINPALKKIYSQSTNLTMVDSKESRFFKWVVVPDKDYRDYLLKFFPNIFKDEAILYNQNDIRSFLSTRKVIYVSSNFKYLKENEYLKNCGKVRVKVIGNGQELAFNDENYEHFIKIDRNFLKWHFFIVIDIFKAFRSLDKNIIFGCFMNYKHRFVKTLGFDLSRSYLKKEKIKIVNFKELIRSDFEYDSIK